MDRLPLAILATIGFTALVLAIVAILFNAPAEDAPGDEHPDTGLETYHGRGI